MTPRRYRPEIDGLRALAVIAVLLFHFDLGLPGGFVGVDVFFVISGYLITGILLRQISEDRFSLRDFWMRRIRRIAPAAVVMVLFSLIVGAILQSPDQFSGLARTVLAHTLIASNCYFSRDLGYFDESAELEPLLHTWSLSVEEQFYVIFPLLVLVIWRWRSKSIFSFILVLTIASLIWSWLTVKSDLSSAFYLLPSRAWELLAGGLLAMITPEKITFGNAKLRELQSVVGLSMIISSMIVFDRELRFPGPIAGIPVGGTLLFIAANGIASKPTWLGKFLSLRLFVFVGLISYSLYLWHWPLLVFANSLVFELSLGWKISLLASSFVCGWLSWRFVETPFRSGPLLRTSRRATSFAAITSTTMIILSWSIFASGGWPGRLPPQTREMMDDVDWNGAGFTSSLGKPKAIGERSEGPIDFILWGDSHGASAAPAVDEAGKQFGLRGQAYLINGNPIVPGLWFADLDRDEAEKMTSLSEDILSEIISKKPRIVILVGRWVARCEGYSETELKRKFADENLSTMVSNNFSGVHDFESCSEALIEQLALLQDRLHQHGIRLCVMQQVPESQLDWIARRFQVSQRFPWIYQIPSHSTTLAEFVSRQNRTMNALNKMRGKGIEIIDPSSQFFTENKRLPLHGERAYFRDNNHLTRTGSKRFLRPVFDTLFSELKASEERD